MIASRLEADGIAVADRRLNLNLTDGERTAARRSWNIPADRVPVAFGVGGKKLRWSMENFEELCRRVVPLGIFPVFLGGRENAAEIAETISRLGCGCNAADMGFNLRQTIAFMGHCKFYVGNDTGTLHMAVAAGLKCVGIYSAQNYPGIWYPYGNGHTVIRHDVRCGGCLKSSCPRGRADCIGDITVDEVEEAVRCMLQK